MYYKIVKKFGPKDGDNWKKYIDWRGLSLVKFDSVDGILRPDLFEPDSKDDWQNSVNEDYKFRMITNLEYAKSVLKRYGNSVLVGVEIELNEGYLPGAGFVGFDVIDGYCDVSLVTNWGIHNKELIDNHVMTNGLVGDLKRAFQIRNKLREDYSEDSHAEDCEVWAIYEVNTLP